jgi:hypothetical protein
MKRKKQTSPRFYPKSKHYTTFCILLEKRVNEENDSHHPLFISFSLVVVSVGVLRVRLI